MFHGTISGTSKVGTATLELYHHKNVNEKLSKHNAWEMSHTTLFHTMNKDMSSFTCDITIYTIYFSFHSSFHSMVWQFECIVCMETYCSTYVDRLKCNHRVCFTCQVRLLSPSCPMCRRSLDRSICIKFVRGLSSLYGLLKLYHELYEEVYFGQIRTRPYAKEV